MSSGASLLASEPAPGRQSTSCLHLCQERRPPVEHSLVRGVSRARVPQHPVQLRLLLLGLQFVVIYKLLCPLHEGGGGQWPFESPQVESSCALRESLWSRISERYPRPHHTRTVYSRPLRPASGPAGGPAHVCM